MKPRKPKHWVAIAAAGLLTSGLAAGCAINPVTGQRQFVLISEAQEIRMGRDYDPMVVAEMGLYPDASWQAYIQDLGEGMARSSERPNLDWTFRVLDDPVVNAFALPGGYNYVTRGILAYFNSEAELAAVLGHEIGHVTARHSVTRMSRGQLAQIGLAVGTAIRPDLEMAAGLASAGLSVLFLAHSRDDERQSDELGLRYMVQAGYDPREMPGVFDMLGAVSQAKGAGRTPEWLASHPHPENRRERIEAQIAALGRDFSNARVGRNDYLRRLDGMVFDENPREGFFRGARFLHPDLEFRIDFPEGWRHANQKQAVFAVSPNQDAIMQVTLSGESSADAAARAFFGDPGISGQALRGTINGLPASGGAFVATTQSGRLRGRIAFVEYGGRVYQLLGYGVEAQWSRYDGAVERGIDSFDRLTDPAALAVQPLRLRIVELPRAMTLAEVAQEFGSAVDLDELVLLNRVDRAARIPAGTLIKTVAGDPVA